MKPTSYITYLRNKNPHTVEVFTNGLCLEFYRLLKLKFPNANAYYDSDHVITEIEGKFYDVTGEVEKVRHLLMSKHYPKQLERGF